MIKEDKQSKKNKINESKGSLKAISSSDLFGKKPVTRIEDTKVSSQLLKMVNIIHKKGMLDQHPVNNIGIFRNPNFIMMMILTLY